jgi:hypothetical protein
MMNAIPDGIDAGQEAPEISGLFFMRALRDVVVTAAANYLQQD